MRIAIIGAKGQLGSDCCSLLGAENDTIGCDLPTVDITDQKSIDSYLDETKPSVIVNSAAYTAVDRCESDTELAWKVNAEGPKFLAQAAARLKARLIHVSTDYVFDGKKPAPSPYIESDTTNPLSEYGKSKLAGEEAVARYAPNHIIIRTAWLYSATGGNFLKTMLRLALADPTRELKVVNDQFGSLTWSYNLALQIKELLNSDVTGIVHATSEGYSTWYEAATYFLDRLDVPYRMVPCTTDEYPTPAVRPTNSILENEKLKSENLSIFDLWKVHLDEFIEKHRDQLLQEALQPQSTAAV